MLFTVIKMQSNTNLLNVIFSWNQNDIFILHTFNPEAPHSSNCQTSANSKRALEVEMFDSLSQLSKWKIRLFSFTILFVHFCTHFLQFAFQFLCHFQLPQLFNLKIPFPLLLMIQIELFAMLHQKKKRCEFTCINGKGTLFLSCRPHLKRRKQPQSYLCFAEGLPAFWIY